MKKNILAVCDTEQEFTCHLTDYLGQLAGSDSFPFEVQVFTNPRALEEFCGKNRAAFLLLTQEVYREALDWEEEILLRASTKLLYSGELSAAA